MLKGCEVRVLARVAQGVGFIRTTRRQITTPTTQIARDLEGLFKDLIADIAEDPL